MKRNATSAHAKHAPKQKESQARSLHTPGPWRLHVGEDYVRIDSLTGVNDVLPETMGVSEQDAKLMALSPELLEALQLMSDHYNDLGKSNPGFMGKLTLQNYELWNKALYSMGRVLNKVTSVQGGSEKV